MRKNRLRYMCYGLAQLRKVPGIPSYTPPAAFGEGRSHAGVDG